MTTQINQLFNHIHQLPQIPELVRIIFNQLNDPNAEMLDIAKNVEKEQVIALKILRLVNSAHFGLSRKVNSIEEATMLIGLAQLKTLVVASGMIASVPNIANFDMKQFWMNSFRTALYAKWFAEKAGLQSEIAYTAGLLSGLGNILIHMGASKEANEIDQHIKAGSSRLEMEKNRLGYTSQAVCAELCQRWKLGNELIAAIAESAEPLLAETPNKLACAVFLSDFIKDKLVQGLQTEEILTAFPVQVSDQISLDEQFIKDHISELLSIKPDFEELLD